MKSRQQYRRLIRIRVAPVPEDKKDEVLKDLIARYRQRFDKRSIVKSAADRDLIVVHWDDMQFGRKNPRLEKWQFVRSGRGGSFKREDLPLDPKGRLDIKKVLILLKLKKKHILGAREMVDQISRDATLYQWGEVVAKEAWSAELGEYAYYVLRLHKDSWQKAHNEFWHLKRDISRMNVLPEKLLDRKSLPMQGIKLVILQAWFKGFGLEARLKDALDKVKQKNAAGLMLKDSGAKRLTAKQRRRARSLVLEQSALDSFKDGGIYYCGSGQAAVATPSVAGGEQLFTAAGAAYLADGGQIVVVAHRGASALAPGNTLAAFSKAIEIGAQEMELDVQLTKDGHIVVIHDTTLEKLNGDTRCVSDIELDELRRINIPGGEYGPQKIPLLEEVIDLARGKIKLQIEIKQVFAKDADICAKLATLLERKGIIRDVLVTSFNPHYLDLIKKINNDVNTGLLLRKAHYINVLSNARSLGVSTVIFNIIRVNADLVEFFKRAGFIVGAWGIGADQGRMKAAITIGLDRVTTDDPFLFRKYLERRSGDRRWDNRGTDGGEPSAADFEAVLREHAARSCHGAPITITYEQLAVWMRQKGFIVSVTEIKKSKRLVAVFSAHPKLSKLMKVTYRGIEFNQDAIIAALEQEKSLSKALDVLKHAFPNEYKDVTYEGFAVVFVNLHPHLRAIWARIKQENNIDRFGRQIQNREPSTRPAAPKALTIELTGSQMRMLEEIADEDPFFSQNGRQSSGLKMVLNEDDMLALQSLELIVLEADNFAYLTQLGANVLAGTVKVKIAVNNDDPVTEQISNGKPSREQILLAAERVKQNKAESIVSDSWVAADLQKAGFDVTVDWLIKQGGIHKILRDRWDLWTRPGSEEWNRRQVKEFLKRFRFDLRGVDSVQARGRARYEQLLGALVQEGLHVDYVILEEILNGNDISKKEYNIRKDPDLTAVLKNDPGLADAIENPRIHKGLGSAAIKKAIRENPTRQDAIRTLNAKTPDLDMKKMSVLAEQYPDIGVLWDQKPELDLAHARSRGYMELELRAVMEPEPVGQEAARQPEKDSRLKAGRQDYLDAAVDAFIKHRIWKPMFIIAALERKGIRGHISEIRRYSEKIDFMRDYRKSIEERLKNASQAKDGGEGDDVRALLRQKLTLLVDTGDRMPAGELRAWLAQEHGVVRERWAIRRSLNALFNENAAFRNAVDEEKRGTAEGSRRIRKLLEGRLAAIVLDHEKEQDIRQLIRWLKTQGIARKHDAIREHLERIFENKPELRIAVDLKGVINEWQRARAHLRMTKSVARTLEKIRHDLPRLSPLGFLLMAAVDPELDPNIIAMVKAYRGELKSVIALRRLLQDRGFLRDFGKINNRKSAQNAIGWLLETGSYEESSGRIGQKTGTLRVFIEQFAYDKTERIKPYIEAAAMGLADPDNIPSDLTRSQKGRMRLSFRVQREELRKEEEYAALYIRESIDATVKPIARREQQLLELIKIKHRQPVKRRYGGSLKSVFARRSSNFLMELIRAAEGNVDMLWEKTVRPLNIIDEAGYRLFMEQTLMKHPRYREEIKWRMSWNQLSDDQIADVWLQAGFSSREERFFEIMAAWTLATNKPFMPGQLGSEAMLIMKEEGRGLVSFLAENFECENIPLLVRFYPSSNYLMSPALARIVLGSDENMQNAADEHAGVAAARANAINERKPWEDVLPWEMSNVVSGEAAAECGPYSQADGGTKTKQVVLVVLDGFGYRTEKEHNAIALAHKPNWDALISRFGFTLLETSGEAVGLPEGEMGSSEVGHQNMGGGRKVKQEVIRIKESIADRSFFNNQVLLEGSRHVQTHPGASLHLMGLLSNAVVHSDLKHLCALLEFAGQEGLQDVYIHPLMDGRDSPPTSGAQWMADLAQESERIRVGSVASVIGRYFAMDRDNNWELIKTAYDLFTQGMGTKAVDPVQAVKNAYERQEKAGTKVSDEHIRPIVMVGKDQQPLAVIKDNDAVIFFNFRADRARQITRAFMDDRFVNDKAFSIRAVDLLGKRAPESLRAWAEKRSRNFERAVRPDIKWLCMTEYDRAFYAFKNLSVIFPPRYVENNLAEYLASLGKKQLHIAETQKFAHSTFFFNGGREEPFAGEDRILIPSPKVDTFDLKPEMSAFKIARKLVKQIKRGVYDFTLVNFANADMVGHEGKLDAAIKAIEVVDQCLGKVLPAVAKQDGIAIVTADHGNAEDMAGKYQTSHTLNPVPFTIFDPAGNLGRVSLRGSGALCDVAPTVLEAMGLPQPPEMTGLSLIKRDGGYDRADGNKKEEGLKQLRAYLREFSAHAYGFTGPTRLLWITQMVRVLLPRKARDALDIRKTIEKQRNDLVRMVRELHETYGFNEQDFRVEAGTLERRARRAQAISFICTAFFVSLFFVNIGSPALFYTGLIASVWAGGWAFSFALNEGHRRKLLIWAVRQEFAAAAPLARHKEQSLSEGIRIETTDGAHLSLTEAEYGGHIKGQLKIVRNASQNHKVWIGDVLVADQTTPDMLPAMKRAGAIIVRTRDYLARNFAKTNRIPFTDGPMFSPDMPGDNAWVDINTLKIIVGPDETLGMTADVSAADIMEYLKKHALEQLQEMQEGRMVEASHIDIKEVFRTYGIDVDALGRMNGEQAQALLNALKLLPEEHLHYLEEIKEVPGRMRGRVGGY
ncbi:MAG: glycerophosphodiester phosphodiesterase family protein, partial [Candidatus Omnitrophica bacterium]|nr:glycerophosphodiester phosphodiesterase family protein [Candidatus Omnitrophota bacterium]